MYKIWFPFGNQVCAMYIKRRLFIDRSNPYIIHIYQNPFLRNHHRIFPAFLFSTKGMKFYIHWDLSRIHIHTHAHRYILNNIIRSSRYNKLKLKPKTVFYASINNISVEIFSTMKLFKTTFYLYLKHGMYAIRVIMGGFKDK